MFEFIFADGNLIFNIALGLMLTIASIEIISMLLGTELSSFIEGLLPDLDILPDADIDGGTDLIEGFNLPLLPSALSFFYIGKVPLLILIIIFLTCFGISGHVLQLIWFKITGALLPVLISTPVAFLGSLPLQKLLGRTAWKLFPKDESTAVSQKSFLGSTAVITTGCARFGDAAEARLTDQFGKSHYVMVETDQAGVEFPAGTEIILIEAINASTFRAVNARKELEKKDPKQIGQNRNQKESL